MRVARGNTTLLFDRPTVASCKERKKSPRHIKQQKKPSNHGQQKCIYAQPFQKTNFHNCRMPRIVSLSEFNPAIENPLFPRFFKRKPRGFFFTVTMMTRVKRGAEKENLYNVRGFPFQQSGNITRIESL